MSTNGDQRSISRLYFFLLKRYFRFSDRLTAVVLGCSVRCVIKLNRELKRLGLRFTKPRSSTCRPTSYLPLPKKPRFNRSLTAYEYAWIRDVNLGKAEIRLEGQTLTGPDAADQLKRLLYRERYKTQYDQWVYEKRHVGHPRGEHE
ncbi:MAG: hypothetical protein AB1772_00685 [Candidatus Zixiibacteriota bacterium]